MMRDQKLCFFIFSIFLISPAISSYNHVPNAIDVWCSGTPYPDICKHFFNTQKGNLYPKPSDLKKLALKIAMERALLAEYKTKELGHKCRNDKEKAAWADCIQLYENTIFQLNKTFTSRKCTDFDSQTWLSSSLTNMETCRSGFVELNATDYIFPLMSNNVTKLIKNSLAMNKNKGSNSEPTEDYREGFPSWVNAGDRKLLQSSSTKANLVVAQDGSGNYRTIQEGLNAAGKMRNGNGRFIIYIKKGVYKENIVIGNKMTNIMLIGDGLKLTIITGSRSVKGGSTTFNSATLAVTGERFIARDITFRNTAGPQNGQAVALRSGSDLSVFYRCGFEGYQDTLYVHSQRQFYRECYIYGTVDFIFGNAAVVFQNCMIYARKPIPGQQCVVTAQGRSDPNQNTGISILNSRVMAAADLKQVQNSVRTYLGRPWREYSRTVYLQTFLDSLINPAGWLEWSGNFALNTLYYGEYRNFGPGSSTTGRVKWKGYRLITSATEASKFTVQNFIAGRSWLPGTGVPFNAGL